MSQLDDIITHLNTKGQNGIKRGLSPMEARFLYGIESLSRRICDLKDRGYKIYSEIRKAPNGKKYARHYLG